MFGFAQVQIESSAGQSEPPAQSGPVEAQHETPDHGLIGGEETIVVNGVEFTAGQLNALVDFVGRSVDDLYAYSADELRTFIELLARDASCEEWDAATGGKSKEELLDNDEHFAPGNDAICPTTGAGGNHLDAWRSGHEVALRLALDAGALDADGSESEGLALMQKAIAANAMAGHFLADAFSSGHLINKNDLMAQAGRQLVPALVPDDLGIIRLIATVCGDVAPRLGSRLAAYEMGGGSDYMNIWLNLSTPGALALALEAARCAAPAAVAAGILGGVVNHVHDQLNAAGVPVANDVMAWRMFGDGALDGETLVQAQRAIGLARENLDVAQGVGASFDTTSLFARAEAAFPKPTPEGVQLLADEVTAATSTYEGVAHAAGCALEMHFEEVMDALVAQSGGVLRRVPEAAAEPEEPSDVKVFGVSAFAYPDSSALLS